MVRVHLKHDQIPQLVRLAHFFNHELLTSFNVQPISSNSQFDGLVQYEALHFK